MKIGSLADLFYAEAKSFKLRKDVSIEEEVAVGFTEVERNAEGSP
jgi:hypothetical protein